MTVLLETRAAVPTARRPLIRLAGVLFCVFLATGMVSALIPLRVAGVTHDYGQLAAITTTYAAVGILASYAWGWLADRMGRRAPFVLGGLASLVAAYVGYLLAGSFVALLAVRAVEGAALAAYNVGSVALLGDYLAHHANRGRLLGAYRTFGSLAFGLTMLTSGTIADHFGPLAPFFCSAIFTAIGSLLALGLREAPTPADAEIERDASSMTRAQAGEQHGSTETMLLASLLVGAFGWHLILTGIYSVWPNYMASVGYSATAITRLWALASLSEVPCMLLMGALVDRLGRRPMLALALGVIGLVVAGYAVLPQLPWIAAIQIIRAVAWSSFLTASLALTIEAGSHARRGRITGLVNAVGSVGDVAGAAAGGTLVRLTGFSSLLWSGSGAALVCAALVLVLRAWPRSVAHAGETPPRRTRRA